LSFVDKIVAIEVSVSEAPAHWLYTGLEYFLLFIVIVLGILIMIIIMTMHSNKCDKSNNTQAAGERRSQWIDALMTWTSHESQAEVCEFLKNPLI